MSAEPNQQPETEAGRLERRSLFTQIMALLGLLWLWRLLLRWLKPASSTPQPQAPTGSARKGHEMRDADARWIFGTIGFLAVFGLAIHFILAGFLSALKHTPPPEDKWRPVEVRGRQPEPAAPAPRLQVSPPTDLAVFRASEDVELSTYGWLNRTSGIVRVPIERAMELVLQEGLPVRRRTNENRVGPSTYQLLQQRTEHREPEIQGTK